AIEALALEDLEHLGLLGLADQQAPGPARQERRLPHRRPPVHRELPGRAAHRASLPPPPQLPRTTSSPVTRATAGSGRPPSTRAMRRGAARRPIPSLATRTVVSGGSV